MSGYKVGPVLAPDERPWPVMWEQDPRVDDGHAHDWESVLLGAADHQRVEEVIRCAVCHAPRCGNSGDENPCIERRHHRTVHIYLNGAYEPVGGVLTSEENRG